LVVGPALQRPPMQTFAPATALLVQRPFSQTVPSTYLRHAPAPSQLPSSPQVAFGSALQAVIGCGDAPGGSGQQVPWWESTLHAIHASAQGLSQQKPSTQALLLHS
jgi:hypothetical protein